MKRLLLGLPLLLTGCINMPDTYAPPMQRRALAGPDTSHLSHFIAMNDPNAPDHFLAGVSPVLEGGLWRWTEQRPAFRFALPSTKHLRLTADFSISSVTFKDTGPITISYSVNGKLLDKVVYDAPGEKHFDKPVDESWLKTGPDNIVTIALDKVWTSPEGSKRGITILRVGFLD